MLSFADLQSRIRAGSLTPEAALALCHDAIAAREAEIGAFAYLPPEPAPAAAQGPLAGIAIGLKDIIDTADMPTGMGSPIYAGWRPRADAAVAARLRRLGATILGKTTTTAFASSDPTETRNPHSLAHTPGGSSAGSAAAVAAGMVPLAFGTQTAGSVIRPASFCGVAAIKPSFRLIPTTGVKCYAWTLDTVGFFAAGVADLAAAFAPVTGRPGSEGALDTPRIGVLLQDFAGPAEPAAQHALEVAGRAIAAAGGKVVEVAAPPALAEGWDVHATIMHFEAAAALGWEYDHHRAALAPEVRGHLDGGRETGAEAYDDARRIANRARRDAKLLFAEVDAILTFAAPGPAPRGLGSTGDARYNRLWTMLGLPCVAVPVVTDDHGMPVGLQIVAPFAQDGRALDVARFLERAVATTQP